MTLSAESGLSVLIEQLHAGCPYSFAQPLIVGLHQPSHSMVVLRLPCRQWYCPYCGDMLKKFWIRRSLYAFDHFESEGKKAHFVTITSHERLSADATVRVLPSAWKKLSMRMRRASPGTAYLVVPERHKDGRLHLHGIFTCNLSTRWWKDNARSCGMGYRNDAQEAISLGGVAYYVSKYVTKHVEKYVWAKGFRHVRTSVHFPKLPKKTVPEWEFYSMRGHTEAEEKTIAFANAGWQITVGNHLNTWEAVWEALDIDK